MPQLQQTKGDGENPKKPAANSEQEPQDLSTAGHMARHIQQDQEDGVGDDPVSFLKQYGDEEAPNGDDRDASMLHDSVQAQGPQSAQVTGDQGNTNNADIEQLFEAVAKGFVGKVDKLLSRGELSPDCRDGEGRTPLMVAADEGNAALAGVLIRHRADVNAVDADGETVAMKAAYGGYLDVVELLVSKGAALGIRNNEGLSAVEIAQQMGHDAVAAFLSAQSHGSKTGIKAETSTEPDDDGPTTGGPAGASPERQLHVQELDLESMPEVEDSQYLKLQQEHETAGEEEVNEATEKREDQEQGEKDNSRGRDGESYPGAPKQKPTVSQMVAKVKTFLVTYVIMGLEAIGAYLLENVFDGNYKKALSKDPYKGTSLTDLADHPDMPLSRQRLGECIRVAGVTQEFKAFGLNLDFLTYYHKLEVSKLKSSEERLKLAQEAQTKTLTVKEVRDRVRKLTGKATTADKRMAQAVIKQLGVFSQMSVDEDTQEFLKDKERLKAALSTGETAKLLDHSEKFREAVGESQEILHRLEKTLVEIVVERRRGDRTEHEEG